ncbi:MAG: hemerythrin domain-containing protein [Azonexus sp.]|jgi:hypothetical protein|nr:hemerythrin domain-containing protein [Azonexus sp.]
MPLFKLPPLDNRNEGATGGAAGRVEFRESDRRAASPPEAPPIIPHERRSHERRVAPGTHIRYDPELTKQLSKEHRALFELLDKINHAVEWRDMVTASRRLEAFRTAFQSHLLTENVRLYVYLERLFADDPASHSLIRDFHREMDELGRTVLKFFTKYEGLAKQPELAASFSRDLAAAGKALTNRIEREEKMLYPLYSRSNQ